MNGYKDYTTWKNWNKDNFSNLSEGDSLYFDKEIFGIKKNIKSILEIGFGNGNFYSWCKKNNIKYTGTEIIDSLLINARNRGIEVYDNLNDINDQFDMIVAFDVFEHIKGEDLLIMLDKMNNLLSHNGVIIAKFPNGDSFLSMIMQNGDYTHINYIGSFKIMHLAELAGLKMIAYKPPNYPIIDKNIIRTVRNIIAKFLRSVMENIVSLFMYKRLGKTMSPNAICVFISNKPKID